MDIKSIKPYTENWFNCKSNLFLSILQTVDEKYKYIACNNEYHYLKKSEATKNCEFNIIEMRTTWSILGDMIKNVTYVNYENDEQFFKLIIDSLSQNKFFFVGVDLFYWIKENFCYGVNHWLHSTMIQKYDDDKELFYVFDVGNEKNYGLFTIGKKELLKAVKEGFFRNELSFYCDMDTNVKVENITIGLYKESAKNLIDDLSNVLDDEYYWMDTKDYDERSYADLNHVFLGRIAQRHIANKKMFDEIYKREVISRDLASEIRCISDELYKGWSLVQCRVYMLYMQKNLKQKIENINIKMKILFNKEKDMWIKFCEALEEKKDDEIVFEFS